MVRPSVFGGDILVQANTVRGLSHSAAALSISL